MSYYFEFDDRHRILLAVAYGRIDEDEMRELYLYIARRKDEQHSLTGILDLSGVTAFDVRWQIVREVAANPPIVMDPTIRAVVAPTDCVFGMFRMFQIIGHETRKDLHIVRTMEEALTLLDAGDAQFRRAEAAEAHFSAA